MPGFSLAPAFAGEEIFGNVMKIGGTIPYAACNPWFFVQL
jgi:hypothetical protein